MILDIVIFNDGFLILHLRWLDKKIIHPIRLNK